jgi:hypothetical protein
VLVAVRSRVPRATWSRSGALAALVGLLGALVLVPAAPAHAAASDVPSYDSRLAVLVNQARLAHGLPPLAQFGPLASQSRTWSLTMASKGFSGFQHDGSYATKASAVCSWTSARENIAYTTGTADSMFRMYMNSPGHRAAILSRDTQFLGVSTVSAPWPGRPGQRIYWNTMRFVGGTCPKAALISASTPSTLTLTPARSRVQPGAATTVRIALVATPKGPTSRSAALWFTPTGGRATLVKRVTLVASAKRAVYRATTTVSQRASGSWQVRYAGRTLSPTVGEAAARRSAWVGLAS